MAILAAVQMQIFSLSRFSGSVSDQFAASSAVDCGRPQRQNHENCPSQGTTDGQRNSSGRVATNAVAKTPCGWPYVLARVSGQESSQLVMQFSSGLKA